MKQIYIHYGSSHFDKSRVKPIRNMPHVKPKGGFWASPIDTNLGWKQWCENDCVGCCNLEESFTFTLKDDAKVLKVWNKEQLKELPKSKAVESFMHEGETVFLDWEQLASQYDAFEVVDIRPLYFSLMHFDVNSILIFDADIVEVEHEQ